MAPPSARDTSWLNIAGSRFESRHGRTYYRVAVCGADPETGFAEAASAYRRFGEFQRCREALLTLLCALALHAGFHDEDAWPGAYVTVSKREG